MGYDSQRASTLATLTRKGQPVTFARTVQGAVDKATDRPTGGPPVHVTAATVAVVLPQEQPRSYGSSDKFENDTLVFSLFRKLLVPGIGMVVTGADDFTPTAGDTVGLIEGATWRVIGSKPLNPDGKGPIMHTVIVKR